MIWDFLCSLNPAQVTGNRSEAKIRDSSMAGVIHEDIRLDMR